MKITKTILIAIALVLGVVCLLGGSYQVELFYGEATANTSLGTYEFYSDKSADIEITIDRAIPANSIIGARVRSEGGGSDTVNMSISYQEY